MTASEIVAVCGVVIAALALAYAAWKDTKSSAKEDGKTSTILGTIDVKLTDISKWQERYEGKQEVYAERLKGVEDSTKSAHHRLDEHETRIGNLERLK